MANCCNNPFLSTISVEGPSGYKRWTPLTGSSKNIEKGVLEVWVAGTCPLPFHQSACGYCVILVLVDYSTQYQHKWCCTGAVSGHFPSQHPERHTDWLRHINHVLHFEHLKSCSAFFQLNVNLLLNFIASNSLKELYVGFESMTSEAEIGLLNCRTLKRSFSVSLVRQFYPVMQVGMNN